MKNKTERKTLQVKLNHVINLYVKSVTTADSKKISKSIKKASKMVAKAIAKENNTSKALHHIHAKTIAPKAMVKKHTQPKVIKRLSLPRVTNKINKTVPVKSSQKKQETPFVSHDGVDKAGKEL